MIYTTGKACLPRRNHRAAAGLLALFAAFLSGAPVALAVKDGEQFQDWHAKCEKLPDDKGEQCFIFQTLVDDKAKQPVLQTVVGYLQGGKPAIIFTVPLGVILRAGVSVQIDGGETIRIPYEHCNPVGCVAGLPLEGKLLDTFKRGSSGKLLIRDGSGREISLEVSLKGFTAGFNALR